VPDQDRSADGSRPLVDVRGLRVSFPARRVTIEAVRGVDFTLGAGECLAVVGESGSGKSVTARALLGLAGARARVEASRLELAGEDLLAMTPRRLREIRGGRIGLVLQDALTSLDPLRTVEAEIAEALRNHRVVGPDRVRERVVELLRDVGVPEPRERARQYAHQLSGGLRQRALIASALAARPEALVADEPTTALDVTTQARLLRLLAAKKAEGMAVLLISHDLAVVAGLADRIAVMYRGEFVEQRPAAELLAAPAHPYTRALLAAVPSAHATPPRRARPGTASGSGTSSGPGVACGSGTASGEGAPLLVAEGLTKSFRGQDGTRRVALDGVSFEVRAGEVLGVVGESGSGKTTVATIVLGLLAPDSGTVRLGGKPWSGLPEAARRPLRPRIQLVPQDPFGSFDPRYPVERIIAEAVPERGEARRRRIGALLDLVGLPGHLLGRRPPQLSGGERQRVAIARALAPRPDLLVCDEPVSALDVSVQAHVLDLLDDLRERLGTAMLFISHDLGVIRRTSDRVLVMRSGRVVETGPVRDVLDHPTHPYTRELIAALPRLGLSAGSPPADAGTRLMRVSAPGSPTAPMTQRELS